MLSPHGWREEDPISVLSQSGHPMVFLSPSLDVSIPVWPTVFFVRGHGGAADVLIQLRRDLRPDPVFVLSTRGFVVQYFGKKSLHSK